MVTYLDDRSASHVRPATVVIQAGNWSFWLITLGISLMGLVLSAQGLQQGYMWMVATEWLDSLVAIRPYWVNGGAKSVPRAA